MKHIRIAVRPEPTRSPAFLAHLLDASAVREARAVDWNRGDSERSTHLYAVDGDAETFASLAADASGVESVTLSGTEDRVAYALLELRDADVPVFGGSATAIDRPGLVVRRPLVYRDGRIRGHIVGEPSVLQSAIDEVPNSVRVEVEAVRGFPSASVNPATALSERQQAAVDAALALGYYDSPRNATHEDIAESLGCAPNTASQHLQKAEAKLVRAGMERFGSSP